MLVRPDVQFLFEHPRTQLTKNVLRSPADARAGAIRPITIRIKFNGNKMHQFCILLIIDYLIFLVYQFSSRKAEKGKYR